MSHSALKHQTCEISLFFLFWQRRLREEETQNRTTTRTTLFKGIFFSSSKNYFFCSYWIDWLFDRLIENACLIITISLLICVFFITGFGNEMEESGLLKLLKSCGGDSGSGRKRWRRRRGGNKWRQREKVKYKIKQCSNRNRSRFSTFIFQVSDASVLASVSLRVKIKSGNTKEMKTTPCRLKFNQSAPCFPSWSNQIELSFFVPSNYGGTQETWRCCQFRGSKVLDVFLTFLKVRWGEKKRFPSKNEKKETWSVGWLQHPHQPAESGLLDGRSTMNLQVDEQKCRWTG